MSADWGKYADDEISFHPGEPVFVLRAQDALAPYALQGYAALLRAAAAGMTHGDSKPGPNQGPVDELRELAHAVEVRAAAMLLWQTEHRVKLPD